MSLLIQLELVSQNPAYAYNPETFSAANSDYVALPEIRSVASTPMLGEKLDVEGTAWIVASVTSYEDQFYLVTCTEDGQYPTYRQGWDLNEPMFLGVYTDMEAQPTLEDGYESCFTSNPEHIALDCNVAGNFSIRAVKALPLTGEPVPWGYATVFICRCSEALAIATEG